MPYQQVTRAQFRQLVRNQLGSNTLFWRDDEINKLIQESLRLWNLLTGYWKARVTLTTTAGTVWYALPSSITSNMRLSWRDYPLTPASSSDMDFGRPNWESEKTTDGGDVPSRPQHFIVAALNLVGIWPADAAGNSNLVVDGIASTPILTKDTDFIDIGQEEFNALLDYIQHAGAFKEGGGEFAATKGMMEAFLKAAGQRSAMLRASASYRKYLGLNRNRQQQPFKLAEDKVGAR